MGSRPGHYDRPGGEWWGSAVIRVLQLHQVGGIQEKPKEV